MHTFKNRNKKKRVIEKKLEALHRLYHEHNIGRVLLTPLSALEIIAFWLTWIFASILLFNEACAILGASLLCYVTAFIPYYLLHDVSYNSQTIAVALEHIAETKKISAQHRLNLQTEHTLVDNQIKLMQLGIRAKENQQLLNIQRTFIFYTTCLAVLKVFQFTCLRPKGYISDKMNILFDEIPSLAFLYCIQFSSSAFKHLSNRPRELRAFLLEHRTMMRMKKKPSLVLDALELKTKMIGQEVLTKRMEDSLDFFNISILITIAFPNRHILLTAKALTLILVYNSIFSQMKQANKLIPPTGPACRNDLTAIELNIKKKEVLHELTYNVSLPRQRAGMR